MSSRSETTEEEQVLRLKFLPRMVVDTVVVVVAVVAALRAMSPTTVFHGAVTDCISRYSCSLYIFHKGS